jgi:hypothetical protein
MNSAALRFIPKEDLEKEGYGEYLKTFAEERPGEKEQNTGFSGVGRRNG